MRLLLLLMCCSTLLFAQENCNLEVSPTPKKNYKKAKRLAEDRRFSESTKYLKKAIADQTDYADAYYLLGKIYFLKENYDKAAKSKKQSWFSIGIGFPCFLILSISCWFLSKSRTVFR